MTYTLLIAVGVFLVLPAAAAVARIASHYRNGARGRPDLESGRIEGFTLAEALARARHPSRLAEGDASGSGTRAKTRRATLRPVFNIGATPAPKGVSPWPSDDSIHEEFDLVTPRHGDQAA